MRIRVYTRGQKNLNKIGLEVVCGRATGTAGGVCGRGLRRAPSPHPRRHLPPPPLGPIRKILLYSILIYSFSANILQQKCLQVDARRRSRVTRQRHLASKTRRENVGGGKFSGTPAGCCGAFSCVPSAPSSANDGAGHSRSISCVYGSHSACTVTHPSTDTIGRWTSRMSTPEE